jgi:hypothetical protein
MDFDVRFIVRDCCDYYYHHHNHSYRFYFTQFALRIHENSINNLKLLTWILNVLTGKVINKFQMTKNRALTN